MTQFLRTHSRAFRFIHEIAGHRYSTHFNLKALTEIFVYIFLNYKTNKVKLPSELSRFVSVQLSLTSSSFALKVNKSETIFHFRTTITKSYLDFYLVVLSRRFLSMTKKTKKQLSDLFTFQYILATNRTKSWEQRKPQNVQFWVAPLRFSTIAWARHRYCVHSIKSAIARCTVCCFFRHKFFTFNIFEIGQLRVTTRFHLQLFDFVSFVT